VVIIARFLWVFPAVYLPRWLSPSLARRDPSPHWQSAFVLAFVGIRGVVSLAAALAIPLTTATGAPFPLRDLILSTTCGVIIITLVGQGVLLPSVVRWLGLSNDTIDERQREHEAELAARAEALALVQCRLDQLAADGQIPPEALATLRARHDYRVGRLPGNMSDRLDAGFVAAELRMELITAEREFIYRLLQEGRITDEGRRRIERELDLEEASVACKGRWSRTPALKPTVEGSAPGLFSKPRRHYQTKLFLETQASRETLIAKPAVRGERKLCAIKRAKQDKFRTIPLRRCRFLGCDTREINHNLSIRSGL
jgi:hypothetical protein